MPSSFAWLDYSARDKRLMLELVDQIREPGTIDELGLGTIRDAFADYLFPGVTTLQSRARYLLFLPWIFEALEEDRQATSANVSDRARDMQARLIAALRAGGQSVGVIGISRGRDLQRLPADIYWGALGQYGIRRYPGSLGSYFVRLDRWKEGQARRQSTRRGDGGELADFTERNWHALPPRPPDLFARADFRLSMAEAQFLEERLLLSCPSSLLAHCLRQQGLLLDGIKRPADVPELRGELQTVTLDSGGFGRLIQGAMLLYNLMLAEKRTAEAPEGLARQPEAERVEAFRGRLREWAGQTIGPELGELRLWQRNGSFRSTATRLAPRARIAIAFCSAWFDRVLDDPMRISDDPGAREAVRSRERHVKGHRSRFVSQSALKNWSGDAGTGEMTFRWGNASILLADIAAGRTGQ